MARAKSTTRIANLHIANNAKDSTWITNHSIGILDTVKVLASALLDEAGSALLDEAGSGLLDEVASDTYEVTTISFVGDENPTTDSEVGLFKLLDS